MPKLLETPRETPGVTPAVGDMAVLDTRSRRSWLRSPSARVANSVLFVAIGIASIALRASESRAQFLEPDPSFKNKKSDVGRILREDKAIPAAEQQMFDDFFRLYAIPQFAAVENLAPINSKSEKEPAAGSSKQLVSSGLPKVRKDFRVYFTQTAGAGGPPHQRANQLALEKFREILKIKAPADAEAEVQSQVAAIKVNVVLAIGEMNEQEAGNNQKAKPLPQALQMLLAIFNAKTADGKTSGMSDALRFAALIGIQRHVESDNLVAETRGNIQQAMLAVAKQKTPPAGRTVSTHNALRRRAATTLGMLGDLGENGAVVKTLNAVLGDPSEPIKVRADFAAALGMFEATPNDNVDCKSVANNIGWLLLDVGRPETVEAGKKEAPAARRRFHACLKDCLEGLTLATTITEPNQRKFVDTIVAKLKTLDKTLDNPKKADNITLAEKCTEQLKDLESALEPRVAPKADQRPVAPAVPAKPPAKEASAVVNKKPAVGKPPKSPTGRPARVDQVSVDKRSTGDKPGSDKQSEDIEARADDVEKATAP